MLDRLIDKAEMWIPSRLPLSARSASTCQIGQKGSPYPICHAQKGPGRASTYKYKSGRFLAVSC